VDAEPRIRVSGTLIADGEEVEGLVELTDMGSQLWRPTAERGSLPSGPGIVIATEAAEDLGVGVGDTIRLRHPVRGADGGFVLVETEVVVAATHGHPIRIYAYMDYSEAGLLGLEGQMNRATALPGSGGISGARQELFEVPGVVSVQEAAEGPRTLRDRLNQFVSIILVMEGALFVLAALIAYNTASINLDERSREHATMLAYGVRPRTIIRMAMVEGFALGLLATALGLAGGYFLARWFIDVLAPRVMPDIGLNLVLSPSSLVIVVVLGVLAVALTPLLGWRRLRRMNLPSALRLME
jgi:putative ABC transport system permease protein